MTLTSKSTSLVLMFKTRVLGSWSTREQKENTKVMLTIWGKG